MNVLLFKCILFGIVCASCAGGSRLSSAHELSKAIEHVFNNCLQASLKQNWCSVCTAVAMK